MIDVIYFHFKGWHRFYFSAISTLYTISCLHWYTNRVWCSLLVSRSTYFCHHFALGHGRHISNCHGELLFNWRWRMFRTMLEFSATDSYTLMLKIKYNTTQFCVFCIVLFIWSVLCRLLWVFHSHCCGLCHGNAFHVTGSLWGETTDHRWIPLAKGQWRAFFYVSFGVSLNKLLDKQSIFFIDLRGC